MQSTPKLSVGMPVFNGEKWIAQAIESILVQSYADFELVICDNASSDDTAAICRRAAADSRVRYHRNDSNIGVYQNYDRVFELSSGEYFKWASCSDVCLQGFFEKCMAVLEARDDVVLAYPRAVFLLDQSGRSVKYEDRLNLDFEPASRRYAEYLKREKFNNVMNGVMRARALRRTALNLPISGSDINMIAELTLHGRFVEIPDRLFVRRFDPETTAILMGASTDRQRKAGYLGRASLGQRVRLHSHRFVTALRAPISVAEKARVWLHLVRHYAAMLPRACLRVIRARARS